MNAGGGPPARMVATTCCIVGGGPAGMMLGFLLARAGIDVVVLEKHVDFLRDFRGDTIHPSTLAVMEELGLLKELLQRPNNPVRKLTVLVGDTPVTLANFSFLPKERDFIAMMPQWDFLDFPRRAGAQLSQLQADHAGQRRRSRRRGRPHRRRARDDARWTNGSACRPGRRLRRTPLDRARTRRLEVEDIGAPIDVLWLRLSRKPDDPGTGGRIDTGSFIAMLDRGDYWQLAYVIPKGGAERVRAAGLPAFRQTLAKALPFLADRVGELKSWDEVKLLTVAIDRLRTWYKPGLLCIGDAAHAMSPVGGVGINLAIQDAVATANLLWKPLKYGTLTESDLARVQHRREFPMKVTQRLQVMAQNNIVQPVLKSSGPLKPPFILRLVDRVPRLQHILARLVGIGVRPEHVHSPAAVLPPTSA